MKIFALIFVSAAVAVLQIDATEPDITEEMTEWMTQCGEESGISESDSKKLEKMDYAGIDDGKFNDWSVCWFRKSKMIDENGKIKTDLLLEIADKIARTPSFEKSEQDIKAFTESVQSCCKKAEEDMTDRSRAAGGLMKCLTEIKDK